MGAARCRFAADSKAGADAAERLEGGFFRRKSA
jgi:hypothetical protein